MGGPSGAGCRPRINHGQWPPLGDRIRLIVLMEQSTNALRLSRNVERSDGLAHDPSAGQRWLGFRTRCQPVGPSRGVADKRHERHCPWN
jgi:hypothetical protein